MMAVLERYRVGADLQNMRFGVCVGPRRHLRSWVAKGALLLCIEKNNAQRYSRFSA